MDAFTDNFDRYVCTGDTITATVNGFDVTARIVHDPDYRIDDDDCHNEDQTVTGCDDEQFAKLLKARKAWFDDEWFYCGVVLSVERGGVTLDEHAASLWGIEVNYPDGDNSYLREVANELADEAFKSGQAVLETLTA